MDFRYCIIISLFFLNIYCGKIVSAQSHDRNYVMTVEPIEGSTEEPYLYYDFSRITVDYYDDLGRIKSRVKAGGTYSVIDQADFYMYDAQGRLYKQFLPVRTYNIGGYYPGDDFEVLAEEFHGDKYGYTLTNYDYTDDNRVLSVTGPGELWHTSGKRVHRQYDVNCDRPHYRCMRYDVGNDGKLYNKGLYPPGRLKVTEYIDENGDKEMIFINREGRKALHRQINGLDIVDTYWIYDMFGRLRYILSPEGSTRLSVEGLCDEDVINRYCYRYEYDDRRRCIEKQLPGAEPVYYVYDRLGRVIFSQDGVQRTKNEWSVFKYDHKHRIAVEGRAVMPLSFREALQAQWGDTLFMERYDASIMMEVKLKYTSNLDVPNFIADKAYFYDDYSHWEKTIPTATGFLNCSNISARGLQTGTAVTDFSGNVYVTMNVFDAKGNITLSCERDVYSQIYQINEYRKYNFLNQCTEKRRETQMLEEGLIEENHIEEWRYEQTMWGHLIETRYRYGGTGSWTILARYIYDDSDRMTNCYYNGDKNKIDYSYNIRGNLLTQTGPKFRQELYYGEVPDSTVVARFDGTISMLEEDRWNGTTKTEYAKKIYYDKMGRIIRVKDSDSTVYNERYEYDLNGNVTEIVRGYTGNEIGSLQFSFDGNRLHSLSQSTNNFELLDTFPIYTGPTIGELTDPVVYDESGRVVEDASRGITSITYNPLNLPKKIQLGSNDAIYMTYRADGVKVSEKTEHRYVKIVERVNSDGDTVYTERGVLELVNREYYGSMIKETGRPTRIYNEMGYIDIHRSDSIEFCYFERDYLGSIRAVTDADGRLLQSVDFHVSGNPVVNVVSDRQATNRLHTGKEFQPFQGVALYDNQARYYDPIGSKFLTMDPLCEKYPSLSPYSHCANNPLSIIDPDGRELVYSEEMTEDQQNSLNSSLDALKGSLLFSTIYNKLDKSPNRYTVQFGETVKINENDYAPGQFAPNSDGGGTITFNENMEMALSTTAEEYYHAYQTEVPSSFDNITNLEFEAKVFAMGASYEAGGLQCSLYGEYNISQKIYNGIYSDGSSAFGNFSTTNFYSDYINFGTMFQNKHINLGSNYNYTRPVTFIPGRLKFIINQINFMNLTK